MGGRKARRCTERNAKREMEKAEKRKLYDVWRKDKELQNKCTNYYNGSRKGDRNIANRKNGNTSSEEEIDERLNIAAELLKCDKIYLKDIIEDFKKIDDPRNQGYIDYTVAELLVFGLLSFRFHALSRRDSNAKMSPILLDNIKAFFPEIKGMPHADTLGNFLMRADADQIERVKLCLIDRLIRKKALDAFRIGDNIPIVIDGVHKFTRDYEWCLNSLKKHVKGESPEINQYYVNALEASIILPDGHTLPVMTEFMDRDKYGDCGTETEKSKQDCETNAAKRLIERLRKWHPQLKISLSLDGLYATGPMFELCLQKDIDVMVVLQEKSLPSVWEEINSHINFGMSEMKPAFECNGVRQEFTWVNDINYCYDNKGSHVINLHAAVCTETRVEFSKETATVNNRNSKFAWISLKRFSAKNVEMRCNKLGRPRWNIETQNRIEKYDGYAYAHCFSYDWDAMRAYHYLMQIAFILNMLALLSTGLAPLVKRIGYKMTILLLWKIFDGFILYDAVRVLIPDKYQIRWAI